MNEKLFFLVVCKRSEKREHFMLNKLAVLKYSTSTREDKIYICQYEKGKSFFMHKMIDQTQGGNY